MFSACLSYCRDPHVDAEEVQNSTDFNPIFEAGAKQIDVKPVEHQGELEEIAIYSGKIAIYSGNLC